VFFLIRLIAFGALAALAYLGLPVPKDWAGMKDALAGLESFLNARAAYPSLFAFTIGSAFGLWIIPDIWRIFRDWKFPKAARPDMDVKDAFAYVMIRSKWSLGRPYKPNGPRFLEEEVESIMRNAAAQGRITIWGEPREENLFGNTQVAIPSSDWEVTSFDLTRVISELPATTYRLRGDAPGYDNLFACKAQVRREWAAAFLLRLLLDWHWWGRMRTTR
jgi:hypothetical protein